MTDVQIIEGDTRRPVAGHLTYGLDIDIPDPRVPMGPTYWSMGRAGEWLWPVTVERTQTRTRIGFAYLPPPGS